MCTEVFLCLVIFLRVFVATTEAVVLFEVFLTRVEWTLVVLLSPTLIYSVVLHSELNL